MASYKRTVTFRRKARPKRKTAAQKRASKVMKMADKLLIQGKAKSRSKAMKMAWDKVG